jgi:hypothetical protein
MKGNRNVKDKDPCKEIVLGNEYVFYNLPEASRIGMIGTHFKTVTRCQPGGKVLVGNRVYFPVDLASGEFNYGYRQGLIFVNPVVEVVAEEHGMLEHWFRVGAKSPDDLDIELDIYGDESRLLKARKKILSYMSKEWNVHLVKYRELLRVLNNRIGGRMIRDGRTTL